MLSTTNAGQSIDNLSDQDPPFQFTKLELDGKLFEAIITPGVPEDVSIGDLLAEINFEEENLAWVGRWIYGDPGSTSAMVAIFEIDGQWRCFVDINRDRIFQPHEVLDSIEGLPGHWSTSLTAIQIDPTGLDADSLAYPVRIRFDENLSVAFIATAGTMDGNVMFKDGRVMARYEDRNANGLWFDPEDRLFVDFNADGQINQITERLPGQGMRLISGQLYTIAGDPQGLSLALAPVMEQGEIIPRIDSLADGAEIVSLKAAVGSTHGIRIPIERLDHSVSLPTGSWHVKEVFLKIKQDDEYFEFTFVHRGGKTAIEVGADQSIDLELLGELKLTAVTNKISTTGSDRIVIMPLLTTETGCYLQGAKLGKHAANIENRLLSFTQFPSVSSWEVGSSGFS